MLPVAQVRHTSDRSFLLKLIDSFPDCRFTMKALIKDSLHDWLLTESIQMLGNVHSNYRDGLRRYSALDKASIASMTGWLLLKRGERGVP